MVISILDVVIILILGCFIYSGYRKGLVEMIFSFFSFFISILLTNLLYPSVARTLRTNDSLFKFLKDSTAAALPIDKVFSGSGKAAEFQYINSLDIPEFLKRPLYENSNQEIYKMLRVSDLNDYIAGFLANIFVSAIALLIVFVLVFFGLRILARSFNIIVSFPVINIMNRVGGLTVGLIEGVMLLFLAVALSTLFTTSSSYSWICEMAQTSLIARYFYDGNFILNALLSSL